jgi:hypothetical protein
MTDHERNEDAVQNGAKVRTHLKRKRVLVRYVGNYVLMESIMIMAVFGVVASCGLVKLTSVSEVFAAYFTRRLYEEGSKYL